VRVNLWSGYGVVCEEEDEEEADVAVW